MSLYFKKMLATSRRLFFIVKCFNFIPSDKRNANLFVQHHDTLVPCRWKRDILFFLRYEFRMKKYLWMFCKSNKIFHPFSSIMSAKKICFDDNDIDDCEKTNSGKKDKWFMLQKPHWFYQGSWNANKNTWKCVARFTNLILNYRSTRKMLAVRQVHLLS